jgi:hypothetical protein
LRFRLLLRLRAATKLIGRRSYTSYADPSAEHFDNEADALNAAFGVPGLFDETVVGDATIRYRLFPF